MHSQLYRCALPWCITLTFCSIMVAAELRTWNDKSGKFSVEAELVELKDGRAVLKRADGRTITVPLERLSDKDLEYAQRQNRAASPATKQLSLPDAMTEPPSWLANDSNTPLDIVEFFNAPPDEENAAPLYLLALSEFSWDEASMLLGIDSEKEPEKAKQLRAERKPRDEAFYKVIEQYWESQENPQASPPPTPEAIAAVLKPYQQGLDLLVQAQRRPHCVFEPARDITALTPHHSVARAAVRRLLLSGVGCLQQGDVDGAIACIPPALRLSRDLRPRGDEIAQLVAIAIEGMMLASDGLMGAILAAPSLTTEQCDNILAIMKTHQASRIDPFVDVCCCSYISSRLVVHDLETGEYRTTMQRIGARPPKGPMDYLGLVSDLGFGSSLLVKQHPTLGPSWNDRARRKQIAAMHGQTIRSMDSAAYKTELAALDACYRSLKALANVSNRKRRERIEAACKPLVDTNIVVFLKPQVTTNYLSAEMRSEAILGGTTCLVALRRWQIDKGEAVTDLGIALRAAGIDQIPVDPYNGEPLRMTTIDSQPVVYFVGPDGKDDGGLTKWDRSAGGKGDFVFTLPATN